MVWNNWHREGSTKQILPKRTVTSIRNHLADRQGWWGGKGQLQIMTRKEIKSATVKRSYWNTGDILPTIPLPHSALWRNTATRQNFWSAFPERANVQKGSPGFSSRKEGSIELSRGTLNSKVLSSPRLTLAHGPFCFYPLLNICTIALLEQSKMPALPSQQAPLR